MLFFIPNILNFILLSTFEFPGSHVIETILIIVVFLVIFFGALFTKASNSKKKKLKELYSPNSFLEETDVLGLSKPAGPSLVSETPGVKNPKMLFQLFVLGFLIIVAVFTLKINTPDQFKNSVGLSEEEKRIQFNNQLFYYNYGCIRSFPYWDYKGPVFKQGKPKK